MHTREEAEGLSEDDGASQVAGEEVRHRRKLLVVDKQEKQKKLGKRVLVLLVLVLDY